MPENDAAYWNDRHEPVLSEEARGNSNDELDVTKFHSEQTVKLAPFRLAMFTLFFVVAVAVAALPGRKPK